jgi:hypothetical protein
MPTAWEKLQVHLVQNYGREIMNEMLAFAKDVAFEEREACAKLTEKMALVQEYRDGIDYRLGDVDCIAAAIRARIER